MKCFPFSFILAAVSMLAVMPTEAFDVYYVHTDHLGTPQLITDSEQEVRWKVVRNPWGKVVDVVEDSLPNQVALPGQYHDLETGYYYNWNRYYDASLGRYLQSDPIGLYDGPNLYNYAHANPVVYSDPTGLYTLGDAVNSLRQKGVKPADNIVGIFPRYTDTQVFDEWLELERANTAWLDEVPSCPEKLDQCNTDAWSYPKSANSLHPGGVHEVRSVTTPGGHSNQCIYDANGDLMLEIPAAGSADFRACPNPPFCMDHYYHDVSTFNTAGRLNRINDYYSVRPVK